MGAAAQQPSLLRVIRQIQRDINDLRKRASLKNASISSGALTVKDSGKLLLTNGSGSDIQLDASGFPKITMVNPNAPDNPSTITGVNGGDEVAMLFQSGIDPDTQSQTSIGMRGQRMELNIVSAYTGQSTLALSTDNGVQAYHVSTTGDFDGGYLDVIQGGMQVGAQDAIGFTTSLSTFTGQPLQYQGTWPSNSVEAPDSGLAVGQSSTGLAGDTSYSVVYGWTMASTMIPTASLVDTTVHPASITAESTTGFTFSWTTASHVGYLVNYWAFRV